jgi:cellulose synthase/poly-beta-1,6-N-acetylglucosamine synthase-like glycosyltransferase
MTVLSFLEALCLSAAVLTALPIAVLVAESLAALLPQRRRPPPPTGARPGCVVLIPAHNEEGSIGHTVESLWAQLGPQDRVVVVADNCDDRTASVARACGAMAVVRSDLNRRGKGFALDFGVRALAPNPPEVVILVDADCRPAEGAIDRLVRESAARQGPVQAVYLMDLRHGAGVREQISRFAFQYKNLVRPLGLHQLGLPCLMTGTGIALPWPVIRTAPLASGNIVEDMQLGLDLALAGHPTRLCPEALVHGELPPGQRTALTQRTRWEHGHLRTLLHQVPRLAVAAVRRRRIDLLGLAVELSVPPLSLLFLLWVLAGTGSVLVWYFGGSPLPALVLAGSGLALLLSIFTAWLKFGRRRLPLTSLLAVPAYALWKMPIYLRFFLRPQRAWVRTERTSPASNSPGSS